MSAGQAGACVSGSGSPLCLETDLCGLIPCLALTLDPLAPHIKGIETQESDLSLSFDLVFVPYQIRVIVQSR